MRVLSDYLLYGCHSGSTFMHFSLHAALLLSVIANPETARFPKCGNRRAYQDTNACLIHMQVHIIQKLLSIP